MESAVIRVRGEQMRQPQFQLSNIDGLTINRGESLAIVGENGSGKSTLVGLLSGRHPMVGSGVEYNFGEDAHPMLYQNIKEIKFQDSYGADDTEFYYQQRWNSSDVEGRRRVCDELPADALGERVYKAFNLDSIIDKELILLSSGEMRKFQLTKALMSRPKILIMDNPFIGLDAPSRQLLQELLGDLAATNELQIIIVLSRAEETPTFITHIIEMDDMSCSKKYLREEYFAHIKERAIKSYHEMVEQRIAELPIKPVAAETIVEMHNVTIQYSKKRILNNVNLTIRKGEKWAVMGRNGSGKSTLLSLICADNPQSYACDIALFGRKRGTGESIWDIKREIGYVSPEMHRSYRTTTPAINIVASGLFDTIGLHRKMTPEQLDCSMWWMDLFQIKHLADCDFTRLSSGEQRMILLARAFVKSPQLLILDEPLHGLDDNYRQLVLSIIESYTRCGERTAIIVTHYPEEFPSTITNTHTL